MRLFRQGQFGEWGDVFAQGTRQVLAFRLHLMKKVGAVARVAFLEQLKLNFTNRHIIAIWDGLRAHRSKKVDLWLLRPSKFQTFKLPPYAPELNPIEYIWGNVKYHQLASLTPEFETELFDHAKAALCEASASAAIVTPPGGAILRRIKKCGKHVAYAQRALKPYFFDFRAPITPSTRARSRRIFSDIFSDTDHAAFPAGAMPTFFTPRLCKNVANLRTRSTLWRENVHAPLAAPSFT